MHQKLNSKIFVKFRIPFSQVRRSEQTIAMQFILYVVSRKHADCIRTPLRIVVGRVSLQSQITRKTSSIL